MTPLTSVFSKILFVYKEFCDYGTLNCCHNVSLIALGQWRRRLECVVQQQGGHIEHYDMKTVEDYEDCI